MRIDWLIIKKNLEDSASPDEVKEYRRWLSEDKSHADYIEKIGENYKDIKNYKDVTTQQIESQFLDLRTNINVSKRRKLIRRTTTIAASLILFLGISSALYYYTKPTDITSEVAVSKQTAMEKIEDSAVTLSTGGGSIYTIEGKAANESLKVENVKVGAREINYSETAMATEVIEQHTLKVPRGKNWSVILADGTKVYLNADSELQFPSAFVAGEPRVVSLKGEGYFEVTRDKKSQFIVKTTELDVKVYGTKFNINCHRKGVIETVLVEGSISVTTEYNNVETMIKPNQQAIFTSGTNKIVVNDVNASEYILWKDGVFLFNEISVAQVMDQLSNSYDYEIKYLNEGVKNKIVYCKVPRSEKVEPILDALKRSGTIDFEIKGNIIYIK